MPIIMLLCKKRIAVLSVVSAFMLASPGAVNSTTTTNQNETIHLRPNQALVKDLATFDAHAAALMLEICSVRSMVLSQKAHITIALPVTQSDLEARHRNDKPSKPGRTTSLSHDEFWLQRESANEVSLYLLTRIYPSLRRTSTPSGEIIISGEGEPVERNLIKLSLRKILSGADEEVYSPKQWTLLKSTSSQQ